MNETLFILVVHSGEYSDYSADVLAVCTTQKIAKLLAAQNQAEYKRHMQETWQLYSRGGNEIYYEEYKPENIPDELTFDNIPIGICAISNRYRAERGYIIIEAQINKLRDIAKDTFRFQIDDEDEDLP